MTDHLVTDLSYGHLGEATYDPEEHVWIFSRSESLGASIQTLQPLQESLPASLDLSPSNANRTSQRWNAQNKWLAKDVPEVGPASGVLSLLNRDSNKAMADACPSTLLAVGLASDIDKVSSTRKLHILALPGGKAGNLLRLIKPRVEGLGWEGHNGIKLRVLDPASSEECYWLGKGGPIRHISFGVDTEGLTSWLAVRRPESTAILRPLFRRLPVTSTLPKDFLERNKPSRLCPNHILTLESSRTGGRAHADVSFNPWYVRQFAVVDQQGYWSIWDIEGQKRKRVTFEAIPGKFGHVHDGWNMEQGSKPLKNADGWGRILWAANVSTLVVCDRRSIAVFSLKEQPKRLFSPDLINVTSTDWILDVKRSLTKADQIFVLTTTQIFWVQITAVGEDGDNESRDVGSKILLSCRHFRHGEDDALKLEIVEEDDVCVVFVYSGHNELIQTYQFGFSSEVSTVATCSSSSFTVLKDTHIEPDALGAMQTLTVLPTVFLQNPVVPSSGPAKEYLGRNVQIYQLLALNKYLALSCSLCSKISTPGTFTSTSSIAHGVLIPTTRARQGVKALSSTLVVEDQFIVPDGLDDNDHRSTVSQALAVPSQKDQTKLINDLSSTINARSLFETAFGGSFDTAFSSLQTEKHTVRDFIENVSIEIEARKNHGPEGFTPLPTIASYAPFSDDPDDVSSILAEFIDGLGQNEDDESQLKVTTAISRIFSFGEGGNPAGIRKGRLEMSFIYDKLVDLWVSSLPPHIPGPTRLAKEKMVRNTAAELYLNSVSISIRDRSVPIPEPTSEPKSLSLVLPVRGKGDSIAIQERRLEIVGESISSGSSFPAIGMPTPDPTPSVVSRDTSTIGGEPREDEAISRLRGYALSLRSQPLLSGPRLSILSHWPAVPGADPSKYSWESMRKIVGEEENVDSDEDEAFIRRREEARRQRQKERFLKRQRANTSDDVSQIVTRASGSQPDPVHQTFSSQVVQDVPMTQPDRGVFGSRPTQKAVKKRRTRGF